MTTKEVRVREVVKIREELGLDPVSADALPDYIRRVEEQNITREGMGLPPLPLCLGEVREAMSPSRFAAFLERFAPPIGHKGCLSFSGCPAYDAAITGPGSGEADFQLSMPPRP
jgi:hypothetical protein